jgi:hypothetical protein
MVAMTRKILWIALAAGLLFRPTAEATELRRPYVCKEWDFIVATQDLMVNDPSWPGNKRTKEEQDDLNNNSSLLSAWVDGWSEGYLATHHVKDPDQTWLLNRYLTFYCMSYPGETLSDALKHLDFEQVEHIRAIPGLSQEIIAFMAYQARKR